MKLHGYHLVIEYENFSARKGQRYLYLDYDIANPDGYFRFIAEVEKALNTEKFVINNIIHLGSFDVHLCDKCGKYCWCGEGNSFLATVKAGQMLEIKQDMTFPCSHKCEVKR